jgi:ubiquinone/menaquinone biosynthesis C-methylase UbiE
MFSLSRRKKSTPDEEIERQRYDQYALEELQLVKIGDAGTALADITELHKAPFLKYYDEISRKIEPSMNVLELGAGTGRHTSVIYSDAFNLTALDISRKSLALLKARLPGVEALVASMEEIPLPAKSIDMIISSGSLSYGDPDLVNKEIFRLLKPGGHLIVLDSLNGNPIYRLNRWLHYARGKRTKSTISRIPDKARIRSLSLDFNNSEIFYFGSYLPIMELLQVFLGPDRANQINLKLEKRYPSKKNAFKFVLTCSALKN